MIKDKLSSVKTHLSYTWPLYGAAAAVIGCVAIEAKYPGTFNVEKEEPIPTVKIIHVHVNE